MPHVIGSRLPAAYAAAAAADLGITAVRLQAVRHARYAGHADPSFYYQLARNLAEGRGATVDFVWHFLVTPPAVHHYAPDYWQPLPSLLMAAAMRLTGGSGLRTALVASVLAGALVPAAAALLARALSERPLLPPAVAGLTALVPALSRWSVQTESATFYACFVLLALALACGRGGGPARWPLAGIAAAAAYLCRNDGLVLVALLGAALAGRVLSAWRWDRRRLRDRLAALGGFGAGVLATLAPWVVANLRGMGRPLPPTTRLPFLTSYEDTFSVGGHFGARQLLAGGPGHALWLRWHTLRLEARWTLTAVGLLPAAALLALALAWLALGRRRGPARRDGRFGWPLVAASAAAVLAFHTLVSPVASSAGAWKRSVVAFVPLVLIAIGQALGALGGSRLLRGAVVAALAAQALPAARAVPAHFVEVDNQAGAAPARLRPLLLAAAPARRPVVMTRSPWELTEATGFPSVQIPDDGLCTILRTARRYRVDAIVLPAPRAALRSGAALRASGFTLVGRGQGSSVYRLPARTGECADSDTMPRRRASP
ncbi:MAG TPA: hypothetical protein VFD04_18625 [Actinomycetes bacterium]|nr:hypothetical protein [Actinomycetes bacterium]